VKRLLAWQRCGASHDGVSGLACLVAGILHIGLVQAVAGSVEEAAQVKPAVRLKVLVMLAKSGLYE